MTRARRRLTDESGMTYVFVGLGMMACLSASMLAIDVGLLMTARSQAQNSADAGALAGATALVFEDYDDHSASGPAVMSALAAATANQVVREDVSVGPADVEFLDDGSGETNRVKVSVFRAAARGNPVSMLMARFFNISTANIGATATAEASRADSATCVKPFTIPDRWIERQTGSWDPADRFTAYPTNPSLTPDEYHDATTASHTGYDVERDRGLQLILKAGKDSNIAPSFYYALAIPGSGGASDYESNIENCNTTVMGIGDLLTPENGNMTGPTKHGIGNLIARDPEAYWDVANKRVRSTRSPSPRVAVIPVFDPYYYDTGKHNGRTADLKAANYIGFFIEGINGAGDVTGRITSLVGVRSGTAGPPVGAFAKSILLIK